MVMEKPTKMNRNENQGFAKRSPLQDLKGHQMNKSKTSNLSSSFSSSSSSSSSSTSSSLLYVNSSSSRTHLHRKPKTLPTLSSNAPLKKSSNPRSKENEVPKIPFPQKSTKPLPLRVDKKQCGKSNRKPTIRNGQRSKLCSAQANPARILRSGSRISEGESKKCEENGSGELLLGKVFGVSNHVSSNCTPIGKTFSVCGLDSVSLDCSQNVGGAPIAEADDGKDDDAAAKTPPVEASVSPEIQYGSHFTMPVMKSEATPVCYGAGHLLSGVTDKRKCRRRGSLKGGCEKINLFHDEKNVPIDSRDSLVPLPAEASIRWVLSPCHEDLENRSDQCDDIEKEMCEYLLVVTPNSVSNGNSAIENNSAVSLGSLSSGNIIQTPSSGSSSYGCLGGSKAELVQFELDSLAETLNNVGPLPSSAILKCADMDLSSSIGLSRVQENVNSLCSWVSDSTVENFTLSQTRISWRDGFFSRIDENDEPDFCLCLSDEVADDDTGFGGDRENGLALNSCLKSCPGDVSGENEENDKRMYKDGHEPRISAQGIEKLTSHRLNESAESICTNGGNLVASGDSDWMYFRENHLF